MTRATIRFLDYSREFRITVSKRGESERIRKAFRLATSGKRILVKTDIPALLPLLSHRLRRLGKLRYSMTKEPTDVIYSIQSGESGIPMLRISGKESFNGVFFKWLGQGERPPVPVKRRFKGSVEERRHARMAARQEEYNIQHGERPDSQKIYTPAQKRLQANLRKELAIRNKQSVAATERQARRRKLRKYSLDDFSVMQGQDPFGYDEIP